MAPLPLVRIPEAGGAVLPKPMRLIDKLLWETFDKAFRECTQREEDRAAARLSRLTKSFLPQQQLDSPAPVTSFCCSPDGICVWVGTSSGSVQLLEVGTKTSKEQLVQHAAPVVAVAAVSLPLASSQGQLVAAASSTQLSVHLVAADGSATALSEATPLPSDFELQPPACLDISPDCRHAALTSHNGQLLVCALPTLPTITPAAASGPQLPQAQDKGSTGAAQAQGQAPVAPPAAMLAPLRLVAVLPLGSIQSLVGLPATATLSECQVHWQAPGGNRGVQGIHVYWKGHARLLLLSLNAAPAPAQAAPAPAADKKADAKADSKAAPAKAGAEKAPASAPAPPAATPTQIQAAANWVLPHGICCSCTISNKQLALGLADGSVVLWDDRLQGHRRTLARMDGSIVALAFMSSLHQQLLLACTASGCIRITTLATGVTTNLQLAGCTIAQLRLPGSLPLAHLVTAEGQMMWLNLQLGKLVADMRAPPGSRFACCAGDTVAPVDPASSLDMHQSASISLSAGMCLVYAAVTSAADLVPASRLNSVDQLQRPVATEPPPRKATPTPPVPASPSSKPTAATATAPAPASAPSGSTAVDSSGAAAAVPDSGSILVYDLATIERTLLPDAFDTDNGTPMMIKRMLDDPYSPAPGMAASPLRPRSRLQAGTGTEQHRRSYPGSSAPDSRLSVYDFAPIKPASPGQGGTTGPRTLRVSISTSPTAMLDMQLSASTMRASRETGDSHVSIPIHPRSAGATGRRLSSTLGREGWPQERRRSMPGSGQGKQADGASPQRFSSQSIHADVIEARTQDGKSTAFSSAQTLPPPTGAVDSEALSRVMAKISSSSGGRKHRESQIQKHMAALADRCLKESNMKPSLMV